MAITMQQLIPVNWLRGHFISFLQQKMVKFTASGSKKEQIICHKKQYIVIPRIPCATLNI